MRDLAGRAVRYGSGATALALVSVLTRCVAPPHREKLSAIESLQALVDSGHDMPRPRLPPGIDTNAATSYYHFGAPLIHWGMKLDTAEMSLYWASRLDPAWAEPLYARSRIFLQALQRDAWETWFRTHSVRATRSLTLTPRQIRLVDSLQRISWARNPFLSPDVEPTPFAPGPEAEPFRRAWWAFSKHNYEQAESLFAVALRKHPESVGTHVYRARALFLLGRYDSAVVELATARDTLRGQVNAQLAPVLPAVELFDYAIGIARVQQDDFAAAKVAFERALTENIAFYWAHARLAGVQLALHDTAAALAELATSVQLEGHDPALRYYYGAILQQSGYLAEAEEQLRRAIALDPYFAAPYYSLAVNLQTRSDTAAAVEQYQQYVTRAARHDPQLTPALRALAALRRVPVGNR